jgi:hypothetical protein
VNLTLRKLDGNNVELRHNAVRGLFYQIHSAPRIDGAYTNHGVGQLAYEASMATTNTVTDPQKFYRVSGSLAP